MNICKIFYHQNLISRNNCFPRVIKSEKVNDTSLFLNKKISKFIVRNFSSFVINPEVFDNGKLKENKKIADEIIHYVRSKITKVGTRGMELPITDEKLHNFIQINEMIVELRNLREKIFHSQTREKKNIFVSYDISAYLAKKSGCGNCGEMGSTGLMYLPEVGWLGRAGMFQIRRSEKAQLPPGISSATANTHTFLIVGLSSNSKLTKDDQSFGVNAVVADFYSQEESYPLSDMNARLENYYGLDPYGRPKLAKIDPTIDSIHLLCSNIFSANEFIEPFLIFDKVRPGAIEIANLLNSFNVSISRENRINTANEIINKMPLILNTLDGMNIREYKLLKEQTEQLKQSLQQEVDVNCMSEIDFNIKKVIAIVNQINVCQDNIYSLHSQLEKFKNPKGLSFEIYKSIPRNK